MGPSGPANDPDNTVKYRDYAPTSMGNFPAGTAGEGGTAHPERFYTLVADLPDEQSAGYDYYNPGNGNQYEDFSFSYSQTPGLYVVGWELQDQNHVEIDPRTAAMVFATGNEIQPVADGPTFMASGGGWYLNVGAPTPALLGQQPLRDPGEPERGVSGLVPPVVARPPGARGNPEGRGNQRRAAQKEH